MSIKRESSYGNSPGIISRGSASTRGSVRYDTNPIRHLPIQLTDFSVFGYWIQWDTLIVRQMRRFSAVSELLYANVPAAVSPCDLGDGPRAQVTDWHIKDSKTVYARCFYFAWLKSPGRQSLRGDAGGVCRCRTAAQWLLLSLNCPTQSSGYYDRWQGLEKENTEVSFPASFPTRRVPCAQRFPYHE
ncbi:hypothetical protein BDW60DRAFT_123716 [Aspergillus nidulans var. acristatus]